MKLTQLVVKNLSELDYTAPILWKIKTENPNTSISVLYCNPTRYQFIRDSRFYSDLFRDFDIRELDFLDYPKVPIKFFNESLRHLISVSSADRPTLSGLISKLRTEGLGAIFKAQNWWLLFQFISKTAIVSIQKISQRLVATENVLPQINPDVILLGNRTKTDFKGREHFFRYFYKEKKPVILLPHGTHEVHPTKEFIPFDERGQPLAAFNNFWSSLQYEEPWRNYPEKRELFTSIGYPGLDEEWFNFIRSKALNTKKENLQCVFIIRKFLQKGEVRPIDCDPFTRNYDEMLDFINSVCAELNNSKKRIRLIIKPHPSNNYTTLKQLLRDSCAKNWEISHEPIYDLLNSTDFAISIFSTTLLVPAMFGVPVIILDSDLQRFVHDRWPLLGEMYGGMKYYLADNTLFPETLTALLNDLDGARNCDVSHLRKYFPDGASSKALARIENLYSNAKGAEV